MPSPVSIVLYQPVIPQNTGSIARLCACTGADLHLIHPLGFRTDEAAVKRAGLDYWPHVSVTEHESWESFLLTHSAPLYLFSKFATQSVFDTHLATPCSLVFGSETSGLPETIRTRYKDRLLLIPMRKTIVRSLNLAQSAAVALYETLRQNGLTPS